jgi:Lon-like protease
MKAINSTRTLSTARAVFSGFLALVFCYLMLFVELPYYIFQPGTAENIRSMVHINSGGYPESGSILLTTVGVSKTTPAKLIEAQLRSYDVRKITEVRQNGESDEEYGQRQHQVMLTSQADAIQSAYRAAGIPYSIINAGLTVLRTTAGYPAYGILEAGDVILSADGTSVASAGDLSRVFSGKSAGESVTVMYRRGSVIMEAAFTLRALPGNGQNTEQLGIGVITADMKAVQPAEAGDSVSIEAGEIGGPSAGFMFALEIYGLLLPEDLTKGYKIAGTGTISPEGKIGVIGSIRHKVAAADREGADVFFTPKDWVPQEGDSSQPVRNASEAQKEAGKLHSKMKVVAVDTLQDAILYLEGLPPKETVGS